MTTTTTTRRQGDVTHGEAKGLLSLALMSLAEIKGLGYRERWLAERHAKAVHVENAAHEDNVRGFILGLPLSRVAKTYLCWRREDGGSARRERIKSLAIDFLVRSRSRNLPEDERLIAAAQRELIGFALVKLGLGHLDYAKQWLPKRRKLHAGGDQ